MARGSRAPSKDFLAIRHAALPEGCWKPRPSQGGISYGLCLVDYLDNSHQKTSAEKGVFSGLVFLHGLFEEHMTIAAALSLPQLPHLNQVITAISSQPAKYRDIDDTWATGTFKFDSTLTPIDITAFAITAIVRKVDNSANQVDRLPGSGTTPAWPPHCLRGSREKRRCNKYAIALSLLGYWKTETRDSRPRSAANKHVMKEELAVYIQRIKNANPGYTQQQALLPSGSPTTAVPALPRHTPMPETPAQRQPSSPRWPYSSTFSRPSSSSLSSLPGGGSSRSAIKREPSAENAEVLHVDIDLTMDDEHDDEVVVVKAEKIDPKCSEETGTASDDLEDLQYRLEALSRRKRMLEIEDEQAEIHRKLAKRHYGARS